MLKIMKDSGTTQLESTSLSEQGYKEEDLREWILSDPGAILGEELLVIGREVKVKNIGDGNVVVIELKAGSLSGNVDFQSLKYVAYTSHWDWDVLQEQFDKFKESTWGQELYDEGAEFNEELESFCNDEYELNQDQRMLLVGESIRDRLGFVVRWLSDKEIEISVVEIELMRDGEQFYLDVEQTIPVSEDAFSGLRPDTSTEPWKVDGRSWHIEKKLNEQVASLLKEVVGGLEDVESLDGPHWGQKQYVSFRKNRKNRVIARTRTTVFKLEIYDISVEDIDVDELADIADVSIDDVSTDAEDLRGGRPGVRVTFSGDESPDIERLSNTIETYLA
jgi:hypothetical protein